jgi:uncharacterized protein
MSEVSAHQMPKVPENQVDASALIVQDPTASDAARAIALVQQNPPANSAPLGLTALALPLAALSWIYIGMVSPTVLPVALTTLLFYGGVAQFAVSMWQVRRGNSFGAVAFGTFGLFDISAWYFFSYALPKIPLAQQRNALALFLGLWAIPFFILWIASFRTTLVINLISVLATAFFILAAWGNGAGNTGLVKAAGGVGIALAALAWYGCAASLLRENFGRTVLPNPHLRGRARAPGAPRAKEKEMPEVPANQPDASALSIDDPTASNAARAIALLQQNPPADPAPLGLTALAVPLLALSWINIGRVSPAVLPVVLTTILFYGGVGQFVVAMWEMRRGNTFGAVAFGTFGLFNVSVWYYFTHALPAIPLTQQRNAAALFLGLWAIPAFIVWIASFRTTLVVNLIFMLATALFILAAWGNGAGNNGLVKAAGWVGIALAAIAWYGCAAALISETFGRTVLPNPHLQGRAHASP